MQRWLVFIYGVFCYLMFLGVFVYAILFIGNFWVPNTLEGEPVLGFWLALTIDLALLTFFALQHSGMARTEFKQSITRFIPEAAERGKKVRIAGDEARAEPWEPRALRERLKRQHIGKLPVSASATSRAPGGGSLA